jgi:hypothetical protein
MTRIQRHLHEVHQALSARSGPPSRARLLGVLDRYARAGVFPRPTSDRSRPRRIEPPRAYDGPGHPLFRDQHGTFCAVGELIHATDPALAQDLAERWADAFLPEIDDPRVARWAEEQGFELDELAWIQPSYCWEIPLCSEYEDLAAPEVREAEDCGGPNPVLQSAWSCQDCDGPYTVRWWIGNPSDVAVTGLRVEMIDQDGAVLMSQDEITVAANQTVDVVFTAADHTAFKGTRIQLVPVEDCDPAQSIVDYEYGQDGPGSIYLDASCDEGSCADEGGSEEGDDTDGTDGTVDHDGNQALTQTACLCASGRGPAAPWLLALAGWAARRRSRRAA